MLLVLALGFSVSRVTSSGAKFALQTPCSASSLSAPFSGPLPITQVTNYGCEDGWGFLWATIGNGAHAVGVTEVVRYDAGNGRWTVAKRLRVCSPRIMPRDIYLLGCFSN